MTEFESDSGPPAAPTKRNGWGADSAAESADPFGEKGAINVDSANDDGVMAFIPDLDDIQEEEEVLKVAEAPRVAASRVQTLKELDQNVRYRPPTTEEGVDLTPIVSVMMPYGKIEEKDDPWDPDRTFLNVLSEICAEKDAKEEEKDDDHDT